VRPELDRPAVVGEPGAFHPRQWIAAWLAEQSGPWGDGSSRRSPDGRDAGRCPGFADRQTAPVDGSTPSRSTTHAPDRIRQDRRRLPEVAHVREARRRSSSTSRLADQVGCASDRSRHNVKPSGPGAETAGGTTPLDRLTLPGPPQLRPRDGMLTDPLRVARAPFEVLTMDRNGIDGPTRRDRCRPRGRVTGWEPATARVVTGSVRLASGQEDRDRERRGSYRRRPARLRRRDFDDLERSSPR
jgi:hypothetical protein